MEKTLLTNEVRDQIIAARKAGKPYREIAETVGLSRSYVTNICMAAGLKTRKYEKRTDRLEELSSLLCGTTEWPLVYIGKIIEEMVEAGKGGACYSEGNIGLNITSTEIEIVDINTGVLATIQVHFKK